MEPISFGLGVADQTFRVAKSLLQRIDACRNLPKYARLFHKSYTAFIIQFEAIHERLRDKQAEIPDQSHGVFRAHMENVRKRFESEQEALDHVTEQLSGKQFRVRTKRLVRAKSLAAECERLQEMLEKSENVLRDVCLLLGIADVGAQHAGASSSRAAETDRFEPYSIVPHNPPHMLPDFEAKGDDGRPITIEGQAREALLDDKLHANRTVAVVGMPGVGKTTALRWIGHDADVQLRFPDGIYYVSLGKDATTETAIKGICSAVRNSGGAQKASELEKETEMAIVMQGAQEWFHDKTFLFLVDDIWQRGGIGPGLIREVSGIVSGGRDSAMLFTTRDYHLATRSRVVHALPRDAHGPESRRILLRCASFEEDEVQGADVHKAVDCVLDMCAGLPLALAVAGQSVAFVKNTLRRDKETAWISYMNGRSKETGNQDLVESGADEYASLWETLSTALRIADEERIKSGQRRWPLSIAEMYRSLCVLKKQVWITDTAVVHLWGMNCLEDAQEGRKILVGLSLAENEVRKVGDGYVEGMRIHDLVHDLACRMARKLLEVAACHGRLVAGYRSMLDKEGKVVEGCAEWWKVLDEDDGYFAENIVRHLILCGRGGEAVVLLSRPEWVAKQAKEKGILQVEDEFGLAKKYVEEREASSTQDVTGDARGLTLLGKAVRLAVGNIAANPAEVWFQMYGRLMGLRNSSELIQACLSYIEGNAPRPWLRPLGCCLAQPGGSMTDIVSVGSAVHTMVVLGNEREVACGCYDGRVVVVDVEVGVVSRQWQAHEEPIWYIARTRDSGRLVSGSVDGSVKVWDSEIGEQVGGTFEGHTGAVWCVAVVGDGDSVVSGSEDGKVMVWSMGTGCILSTPVQGEGQVKCMAVSADGRVGAVTREDERVRFWNIATGREMGKPLDAGWWTQDMCFTPDGTRLVIGTNNGVTTCDVESGARLRSAAISSVWSVSCTFDGRRIVAGDEDGGIRVLDSETLEAVGEPLEGHIGCVTWVSHMARGDRIVSCSLDGTVRVWSASRGASRTRSKRETHKDILCIAMSPDGTRVVCGSWLGDLRVWDASSGRPIGEPLNGHTEWVNDVAFSADGRRVVSASWDETVRLWDVETRRQVAVFDDHDGDVFCVSIAPDGQVAVSGGDDCTVRVWDLATSDGSHTALVGHTDPVRRVWVSQDGRHIVSADDSDNVRVWDRHAGGSCVASFTHDGASDMSRSELLTAAGKGGGADVVRRQGTRILLQQPDSVVSATFDFQVRQAEFSERWNTLCVLLSDDSIAFLKLEAIT